jgi:hypothetical protein
MGALLEGVTAGAFDDDVAVGFFVFILGFGAGFVFVAAVALVAFFAFFDGGCSSSSEVLSEVSAGKLRFSPVEFGVEAANSGTGGGAGPSAGLDDVSGLMWASCASSAGSNGN